MANKAPVILLTKEQAFAVTRSQGQGQSQRKRKRKHTDAEATRTRRSVARPRGYASARGSYVAPWIPVKGNPTVAQVIQELQGKLGDRVHIPMSLVAKNGTTAMAHFDGSWHRFLVLEGKLCARVIPAAWGDAGPGYMPCDACGFRTSSNELQPVAVGKTNSTVQVFHVCVPCLGEGVLERTSAQGYIARRME